VLLYCLRLRGPLTRRLLRLRAALELAFSMLPKLRSLRRQAA
jgi:hypothetical protein